MDRAMGLRTSSDLAGGLGTRGLLLCLLPTQQHTCLPCPVPSEQAFVGRLGKLTVKVYNHNSMAKINSRCEEFDL